MSYKTTLNLKGYNTLTYILYNGTNLTGQNDHPYINNH